MRPGPGRGLPVIVGLTVALGACAIFERPLLPDPPSLAADHGQKAERLEREGNLRRALDEWKTVLTITPNDPRARERARKLRGRIDRMVADHLRQGRNALSEGNHLGARRHFLAALALDPASRAAFFALQQDVQWVEFITHPVREAETLTTIAERYYGDPARAELIANANRLPANARLQVGMTLRIPDLPGIRLLRHVSAPRLRGPSSPEVSRNITPAYLDALESFDRGDYTLALANVDRLLAANPGHPVGLDLKKAILYELGRHQFDRESYGESYRTLTELAELAPDYEDSSSLLREARDQLVRLHYNQGMRLFREERLAEAIAEWRVVLEYAPEHLNAQRNVEHAERLLEGLEERKRK